MIKRYAKQKNGIIECWCRANEVDAEIERLRGENAMLLAAADADAAAISSLVAEVERLREGEKP